MKARIKIVFTTEYEIIPKHYPDGMTPEQMLKFDIDNTDDDPFTLLEGNGDWEVTGELLPE